MDTYTVEFRIPAEHETVLFETDVKEAAVSVRQTVEADEHAVLIESNC